MIPYGPFSAFYMNNYNVVDKGKCDSCGHDCHCENGSCEYKEIFEYESEIRDCECTSCKCKGYAGYGAT